MLASASAHIVLLPSSAAAIFLKQGVSPEGSAPCPRVRARTDGPARSGASPLRTAAWGLARPRRQHRRGRRRARLSLYLEKYGSEQSSEGAAAHASYTSVYLLITRVHILPISYSQHYESPRCITSCDTAGERGAHSKNHTTDNHNGGISCRSRGLDGWRAVSAAGRRARPVASTGRTSS